MTDRYPVAKCVSDRLDAAFPGNTSSFVSNCKVAAEMDFEVDTSDTASLQAVVNTVFSVLCVPECGNVARDVYNDCGVFPSIVELKGGLCGTNENGDSCYQIYGNALDLIESEIACTRSRQCTCQSELVEGVSEQGCCINVYHDFISGLGFFNYNPRGLYAVCNVNLPADCNNSTLAH